MKQQNDSSMKLAFLKRWSWQEYALLLFILIYCGIQLFVYSQFQHLPSPIYGGDHYRNRAFIENIVDGYPFYSDAFFLGELNYYPWLGSLLFSIPVMLFGFSIEGFMIYFSVFFTIAYAIILYIFGKAVFKNKTYALFLSMLSSFERLFFLTAPGTLSTAVFIPLMFLFFYRLLTEEKQKRKHALLAGIFLGLAGLTYGGSFVQVVSNSALIFFCFFCFDFFKKHSKSKEKVQVLKQYLINGAILYVIAFLIFSIFMLPLQLQYQETYNKVTEYGDKDVALFTPFFVLQIMFQPLVSFAGFVVALSSIFGILGLLYLVFLFRKNRTSKFFIFWFIAIPLVILHHLLSIPLLNTWFNPAHLTSTLFLYPVLIVFGFHFAKEGASQFLKEKRDKLIAYVALFALAGLLVVFMFIGKYTDFAQSQWVQYGKGMDASTQLLYEQGAWFKENLAKNDVVLSYEESGFMISALSGKKVVIARRTHASYFVNINERVADTAVMLYGHDAAKTRELLQKYHITHFYMDAYLLTSPWRTIPSYKSYLDTYDIASFAARERFDIGTVDAKLYDLVIIPPQNISSTFQSMLEPQKVFYFNGNPAAIVYRIKN
ncbi:hypothetical protein C4573_01620 [Candidatus Woesearchaeota archaeon]|nr:MAG: hypothetical protein C4573_01620 [Candidatus Woesearchaeota archaeon]